MSIDSLSGWSVGVVIPAKDEQTTIDSCIRSVLTCLSQARVLSSWVVVVADECSDDTAAIARRTLAGRGEVLETHVKSAGAARRLGTARLLEHFRDVSATRLWFANTDADTHVTPDWIQIQLAHAAAGVVGVAGIVCLDASASEAAKTTHEKFYETAADGTHQHVHGANLSMRADAYIDAGGWSDLALAEDHCLWNRLRRRGWPLLSPVNSVVTTSARVEGRARGGFADTLKARMQGLNAVTQIPS